MNSIRIALASLFTVGALVGGSHALHAVRQAPAMHATTVHAVAAGAPTSAGLPEECCEG